MMKEARASAFLAQKRLGKSNPVRVMFMDEGRFGRMDFPRRCWAPVGIRPTVTAQMVRQYLYGYIAVCPLDGSMASLVLPEVNAESMSVFLNEVSLCYPTEHVVMIMDQAGWHKAKSLVVPENITLFWLPPYSPELNPVEHLWDEIREKWFHNRAFASLDTVQDQLVCALRHLLSNPELVKSITCFDWIES